MRIVRRYHVLLLLILALILWYAWPQLLLWQEQRTGGRPLDQARLEASYSSIAYVLDRHRWTTFPINPALQPLRLVSNATLPAEAAASADPDVTWSYAIEIQFLDANGNILRNHTRYYRSRVTRYRDTRFAKPITASFYIDPRLQPTDGRVSMVNLRRLTAARRMRVRIAQADPGIRDVVLRVYAPEFVPEHKLAAAWNRLSLEQRRQLARGNVYDVDLLTEAERRALVRRRWAGVGPIGVAGQHYRIRKLYTFREIMGKELAPPVPPFGLFVSSERHGVIPIPDPGGRVRLAFDAVDDASVPAGKLMLHWRDPGGRVERRILRPWTDARQRMVLQLQPGTLEVVSNRAGAVRAYLQQSDGGWYEITPHYPYLAIYLTGEEPVHFAVHHVSDHPTVMRFDLRRIWLQGTPSACSSVSYRLLARDGRTVRRGRMAAPVKPSRFDIMTGRWTDSRVSDPVRHYLWLPAEVDEVVFESACPIAINGYDRPDGYLWTTHVPEDYDAAKLLDLQHRMPGWFSVRPLNLKTLLLHNRIPLIQVQIHPRPDEEIQALMQGQYHWQEYQPEGHPAARWLLVPRESPLPPRTRSLPGFYLHLPRDREIQVRMEAEREVLRPNLIFTRTTARPGKLTLWLDGQRYASMEVAGRIGELPLPPLRRGVHQLRLESDAQTSCFINHVNAMDDVYVKRLVYPLRRAPVDFVVDKQPWERNKVISARLFMPAGRMREVRVHVRVRGVQRPYLRDLRGWTFSDRLFVVAPPKSMAKAPVLGKAGMFMDVGQSFFIPLRADLPAGRYRIEMWIEGRDEGYVALTNVLPGRYEERRIVEEAAFENAVEY